MKKKERRHIYSHILRSLTKSQRHIRLNMI